MYIVTEFRYSIVDHKFMISGQSYLLNNRDFGSIEKANLKIGIPSTESRKKESLWSYKDDWERFCKDFVSISNIKKEIVAYRKVNTDKENVN